MSLIEHEQAISPMDQLAEAAASPLERIEPPAWLKELAAMARAASADFITVPSGIRGRPGSILAVMMAGRELGLQPMESLRLVNIINGTPAIAAELKARWIREAGHDLQPVHQDHNRLRLRGVRGDNGQAMEVEWAISRRDETSEPAPDATIAEEIIQQTRNGPQALTEKDNWRMYPGDMMWARCVAQLHRRLFPDVRGGGIYATEELGEGDESERPVVEGSGAAMVSEESSERPSTSTGHETAAPAPAPAAQGTEPGGQVNTTTPIKSERATAPRDSHQTGPSPQPPEPSAEAQKEREQAYRDLARALRGTGTTLRHWVQAVTGKESWGECDTADVVSIVRAVREYRSGRLRLKEEGGLWFVEAVNKGEDDSEAVQSDD